MSDTPSAPAAEAPQSAGAPSAAPPTEGAPPEDTGVAPGTPEAAPWKGKTPEELGRRIADLTKENATYKERFRPYEEAFGTMHEKDQEFFLGFFGALRSGDPTAIGPYADAMRGALDDLSPAQQRAVEAAAQQAAEQGAEQAPFDPYDPANIDKRVQDMLDKRLGEERQQREYETELERTKAAIATESRRIADESGIADFADGSTTLGRALLISANNDFPNEPNLKARLDRAAEKIQEDLNLRAQELLKRKSAGAGPSPVPAGAESPSGVKKPSSLEDAKASANERVAKMFRDSVGN